MSLADDPRAHADDDESLGGNDDPNTNPKSQDTDGDTAGASDPNDPNNDDEGGIYEFPDQAPAEASSGRQDPVDNATGRGSSAEPSSPGPTLHVGDVVVAADNDNIGTVSEVEERKALVYFVNKTEGGAAERWFPIGALTIVREKHKAAALKLLLLAEVLALVATQWVVKGVLRRGDFAVLFGDPGAGKTFVAIDMAARIAAAINCWERPVVQGMVVYIAGEGLFGLRLRLRAWILENPDCAEALHRNLLVLGGPAQFLDDAEFASFLALLAELDPKPALVIVDTLARCMAGGDENSAKDMGLFVQQCDRIRNEIGAAVMVVHHAAKKGDKERGSGALRGAADSMYQVSVEKEDTRWIASEKQKEGPAFDRVGFSLKVVELGLDEDFEVEDSCVVELRPDIAESTPAHPDLGRSSLLICRTLRDSFFEEGATGPQLLEATKLKKANFYKYLREAADKGYVSRSKSGSSYRNRLTPKFKEHRIQ